MNERIRELAKQAGMWRQHYDIGEESPSNLVEFAELIVQECVTTLEQHHPFTKDPEAYLYAISLIEEHFGVKE